MLPHCWNNMSDTNQAVILIFVKDDKVLLERRLPEGTLPSHFLFPGGSIEEDEIDDPVKALKRESTEELGVTPIEFAPINSLIGDTGTTLKPFIITRWKEKIADKILDRGNPLFWEKIDMVIKSPLPSVANMAKMVKEYLKTKV